MQQKNGPLYVSDLFDPHSSSEVGVNVTKSVQFFFFLRRFPKPLEDLTFKDLDKPPLFSSLEHFALIYTLTACSVVQLAVLTHCKIFFFKVWS